MDNPIKYEPIDRSNWGSGPWDTEPDRIEWRVDRIYCVINRGALGAWFGYIGVDTTHPWFNKAPDDLTPHGGVCIGLELNHMFGTNDLKYYGFGWGCWGDYIPAYDSNHDTLIHTYRTGTYAASQVNEGMVLPALVATGRIEKGNLLVVIPTVIVQNVTSVFISSWPSSSNGSGSVNVYGNAAGMLTEYVRRGDLTALAVAADYLDEHPECVPSVPTDEVIVITTDLRCLAGVV